MIAELKKILLRDLGTLKIEVGLYQNEQNMWRIEKQINNSAGTLCMHLIGSLNHFIGAQLGKTGNVRNRKLEFSSSVVSKDQLLTRISETIQMVSSALDSLTETQLEEEYPQLFFGQTVKTGYLLVHVISHLNYHLGQINYHRRLMDN